MLDGWQDWAKQRGGKGLAYVLVGEDGALGGPVAKNLSESEREGLADRVGANPGDCVFFAAGEPSPSRALLGAVRLEVGRRAASPAAAPATRLRRGGPPDDQPVPPPAPRLLFPEVVPGRPPARRVPAPARGAHRRVSGGAATARAVAPPGLPYVAAALLLAGALVSITLNPLVLRLVQRQASNMLQNTPEVAAG